MFDITIIYDDLEFINIVRPRTKKLYLFPNNICTKLIPFSDVCKLDGVLWTSSYQRDQWISINPGFKKFEEIFGYALDPTQFPPVAQRANPYSCIYASDYARGLRILLELWPQLKRQFPLATLDIYYGLRNWGNIPIQEEVWIRTQIDTLKRLDVIDHGQVGHLELARAFSNASLWTYPCTHHETFCITAIKAQFSGAIPVIINNAALQETVRFGFKCNQPNDYKNILFSAINKANNISLNDRIQMREFISESFTWEKMSLKWKKLFETDG